MNSRFKESANPNRGLEAFVGLLINTFLSCWLCMLYFLISVILVVGAVAVILWGYRKGLKPIKKSLLRLSLILFLAICGFYFLNISYKVTSLFIPKQIAPQQSK